MSQSERTGGTRAELFARETLPAPARGRRERVERRLVELAASGRIDAFDVSGWPKRISRADCSRPDVRDLYLAIAAWARERDVRLTPFFGTRECYSTETGERGEWVVLPALCLAIYEDDRLTAVYPHADDDTYRSVLSGLERLAGGSGSRSAESVAVNSAD